MPERDAFDPDPEPFDPATDFDVTFLNPDGDRHLDFEDGYFYRLAPMVNISKFTEVLPCCCVRATLG